MLSCVHAVSDRLVAALCLGSLQQARAFFYVGATLLIILAYMAVGLITEGIDLALTGEARQQTLLGGVGNFLLSGLVGMSTTAFYLDAHDNPDGVTLSSLWLRQSFLSYLAAYVLVVLGVVIGLILLIVPGVVFGLTFVFATFLVIDRGLGPLEAMKESRRMTRGYKWDLLGLLYVLFVIVVLGIVALLIGIFISLPVVSLAFVHAYRVLGGKAAPQPADAVLAT